MKEWDPVEAWARAGEVPEGFEINPLWEQAREAALAGFSGTVEVTLDWPTVKEGPCVACGSWAYSSYRGRPVHMTCAAELAMFVELVSRQQRLEDGSRSALPPGS